MTFVGVLKVMTILAVSIVVAQLVQYETRKNVGEFCILIGALGLVKMMSSSSHLDCIP